MKKDEEILASEAARRLGLTQQSLGMWATRSDAPARKSGRRVFVRWPAFARWREEQLVAAALPGDMDALRARKLAAEASLAEMELARQQGQAIAIKDYEAAIGAFASRFVSLVRALPVRLAHLGKTVEAEADAEVERMITELHQMDDDVLPDPADEEATPGTAADE